MKIAFLKFDEFLTDQEIEESELIVQRGLDGHFYVHKNSVGRPFIKIRYENFLDFLENWCILRT